MNLSRTATIAEDVCASRKKNDPWRTPGGPKKFAVCATDGGKTKLVRFGDPNLEIKRDSAKRRKNFRARHNCDNPGPRTKAKYWACKTWEKGRTVGDVVGEDSTMYTARTALVLESLYGPSWEQRLVDEGFGDVVRGAARGVAGAARKVAQGAVVAGALCGAAGCSAGPAARPAMPQHQPSQVVQSTGAALQGNTDALAALRQKMQAKGVTQGHPLWDRYQKLQQAHAGQQARFSGAQERLGRVQQNDAASREAAQRLTDRYR